MASSSTTPSPQVPRSTVPEGSTEAWRDHKRYLWLIGLVVPSLAFVAGGAECVVEICRLEAVSVTGVEAWKEAIKKQRRACRMEPPYATAGPARTKCKEYSDDAERAACKAQRRSCKRGLRLPSCSLALLLQHVSSPEKAQAH